MPPGVEHAYAFVQQNANDNLIAASMPPGVEHDEIARAQAPGAI